MRWLSLSCYSVGLTLCGLLGGCNAVLGIDEAHAIDGGSFGGQSGGVSQLPPNVYKVVTCDAVEPACGDCLANSCGTKLTECAANAACRAALGGFRECIASKADCTTGDDTCFETNIGLSHDPTVAAFLDCSASCLPSCQKSNLLTLCQLYCGCMQANCAEKSTPSCLESCKSASASDIYCRLDHCEFAAHSQAPAVHCEHAVGTLECPRKSIGNNCSSAKASGLTCTKDSDCCSGDCEPATQICN